MIVDLMDTDAYFAILDVLWEAGANNHDLRVEVPVLIFYLRDDDYIMLKLQYPEIDRLFTVDGGECGD